MEAGTVNVTMYSLPASVCRACKFTKMLLQQNAISYKEVPLAADAAAMEKIKELGYSQAPVVVVDMGDGAQWSWSGLKPTAIERLVRLLGSC